MLVIHRRSLLLLINDCREAGAEHVPTNKRDKRSDEARQQVAAKIAKPVLSRGYRVS